VLSGVTVPRRLRDGLAVAAADPSAGPARPQTSITNPRFPGEAGRSGVNALTPFD
jgi:hypothetical protein